MQFTKSDTVAHEPIFITPYGTVKHFTGGTKITGSATYSTDGNRLISTKDALDNTTTYCYNENTNVLEWVEYPKDTEDNRTEYTYDAWGKVLSQTGSMAWSLGEENPLRYRGYVYDQETELYYLQSRYYDPEVGRFINADAFASTGQGVIGNNMFAYCNNNPICLIDSSGTRPQKEYACEIAHDGGSWISSKLRDVTAEVKAALDEAVSDARNYRAVFGFIAGDNILGTAAIYSRFYYLVNHNADWDIKRKEPWEKTIGTAFPGYGVRVNVVDMSMTPENLGNFTYGILGYAYGIPLDHLIPGSWYAAGFPTGGDELSNEVYDWFFIVLGYEYAVQVYPEKG